MRMENEPIIQKSDTQEDKKGILEQYKDFLTPLAILVAGSMVSLAILASGGFTVSANNLAAAGTQAVDAQPVGSEVLTVTDDDYVRGNPDAPITIIEYSDFQCPYCGRFHPTMQQAMAEYGDQVRWVYRHFPLTQIHPEAQPAAEASECVAEQRGNDGFWQFADAMFANQSKLGAEFYRQVAEQIGVDLAQFDDCTNTHKYKEKIAAQQASGASLGVNGTPGAFVNNFVVRGALPYDENVPGYQPGTQTLKETIEAALKAS